MISARRLEPRTQLTRKPLPVADPTIAALTAAERRVAIAVWHGRAEAELRASGSFSHLAVELADAGAPAELVALARRAIADELRHSMLCWHVACAFAGAGLPAPRRLPVTIPALAGASESMRRVMHVVGMCCLNETTGSAFLEVCREGARGPLVCAALHELLTDEIDHARLGWAFVATLSLEVRAELAAWLPALVAANLGEWRQRPHRIITDALVAQGCPRWDDVDAAVVAAIDDLFVPGFERLGMSLNRAMSARIP
jgi:hypothetical protein